MNQKLQNILDIIQQSEKLDAEQKANLIKAIKDADKELEITAFKLERTEKVKKTTAILLEETIEELEQKRKAVEAQNRELEIEASLERVRTVAMSMNKSEDLLRICEVSFKEFQKLGFDHLRNAVIHIPNDEQKFFMDYDFSELTGGAISKIEYGSHPIVDEYLKKIRSASDTYLEVVINEEQLAGWKDFRKKSGQMDDPRLEDATALYYYLFSIGNGDIGISTFKPINESQLKVLKRFRNVFDLAYRRYTDITQAEAQAREAQIEAALERVRSRTMGMQKSEELKGVIRVVYEQFVHLKMNVDHAGFVVDYTPKGDWHFWIADEQDIPSKITHPYFESVWANQFNEAKENRVDFFATNLNFEEKNKFYNELLSYVPGLPEASKEYYLNCPGLSISTVLLENVSLYIENFSGIPYSDEDNNTLMRFGKVFQQTYTRFLDLQKAEAQAREAQIEVSLERVRSRAMAMHNSDELLEAGELLYKELSKLGIVSLSSGYVLMDKEEKIGWNYGVNPSDGKIMPIAVGIPHTETVVMQSITASWKSQEPFFVIELNPEETIKHQTFIAERSINFPISASQLIAISPERLVLHTFNFKQGYLLIVAGVLLNPEQLEMVVRFTKVFDMTYRRFLDLQKAEVQAREAEIELALERVRARTMAMHKSEELSETTSVLFKQMNELGNKPERMNICIVNEDSGLLEVWSTEQGGSQINHSFNARLDEPTTLAKVYTGWKDKIKSMTVELSGKELVDWIHFVQKEINMPLKEEMVNGKRVHTIAYFSQGFLLMTTPESLPQETISLLERFAAVFNLTYRRFLDLQKAETQAREAQIEAALERVRSRSLAMHKTDELQEVVKVVAEELKSTGVILDSGGAVICTYFQDSKDVIHWTATEDPAHPSVPYLLPYFKDELFDEAWASKNRGDDYYAKEFSYDVKNAFFNYAFEHSDYRQLPDEYKKIILESKSHGLAWAWSKNSAIMIPSIKGELPSEEEKKILIRFAKVFEQSFIRFLDLKKAEVQTREAVKQASLDRVRGEIASMRTSEDLNRITPIIWRELKTLEVPFIRCGVFIVNEDRENVQVYLTTPDGKSLGVLSLAFDSNEITKNTVEYWRKKNVYKEHWNKQEFINWTKSMMELGQVQNAETYQGSSSPPESLYLHFIPFTQGMLYVGDISPLTDEKLDLVKTLAEAFSIAYARYEDFKNLEDAKNKIELTLKELKSAQVQLIHSEKMASLGELTAGIAHEIKNPLNFVNNFSDLSRELIDDVKEELQNNNNEEVLALLEDLKQNLEKINQHGKRADSIVKGMLLHSRGSSGEKTLTDINDLLDQYVNLAYHGMRAQNKEFNISIEKDYDKTLEKINVIPQDLSRVFLNIINNACYAAYDKKKKNSDNNFSPTLSVSTKNLDGKVEIRIGDNGDGIPANIIDKIFQPFFTTKPTGEGTGLGLSLSYDIVTKVHGGELKVETKDGEGTEFIIRFPIV